MQFHFIINPVAGNQISTQIIDIVKDYAASHDDFHYTIQLTEYPKHGTKLAREVTKAGDVVFTIGGDGSTFDVINGLNPGVHLAVIPAGTGNDFIRMYGLPKEMTLKEIVTSTIEGKFVTIDCGRANGYRYINSLNVGLDVEVLLEYNKMRERRSWNAQLIYIVASLKVLMRYHTYKLNFKVDGKPGPQELIILVMMNGKYYGGGFKPTPEASLADGQLDVCYVEKLPFLKVLNLFVKYRSGKHVNQKKVHVHPFNEIVIESPSPITFGCDGEIHYANKVEVTVDKEAISLLVPHDSKL